MTDHVPLTPDYLILTLSSLTLTLKLFFKNFLPKKRGGGTLNYIRECCTDNNSNY
jgi:hypothetical protein